ncbi:MAG: F0F1 ATP synthase subunit epsilon [Alphaproteobacteria bacterium]|nr:F0F1 ATP synthase subunit epsilon [Alphaproteobacteria bacterium]
MTNKDIQLKIVLPYKVLPALEVAQVVLPADRGMMTIIRDRAPTTVLLTNGVLEVLNEQNAAVAKYFIQGGVANIAANKCEVMTERALNFDDVDYEKIQAMKEDHLAELKELSRSFSNLQIEKGDQEMDFYEYISKYLATHK